MIRSLPLALLLCLQACLLFSALDLLPVWTDEQATVEVMAHPVRDIPGTVAKDIHPPLYYVLLRGWRELPLPWSGIARLRAFSGLWALAATLLLDLFWARLLKRPAERWLVLGLWVLSPCLLLYGRMARSYSMQTALTLLAIGLLWRWMREPRSTVRAGAAGAAALALLYTHYVPGVAVLAAFAAVGWRAVGVTRMAATLAAVAVGYAPWAVVLAGALRRWGDAGGFSSRYALSGNPWLEVPLKAAFGLVSLTVGETFAAASLVLVPVVLLLAVRGVRTEEFSGRLVALVGLAGAVGYLGVSRWVSYPFIPARLLWLLPFLLLMVGLGIFALKRPALRWGTAGLILVSYVSSDLFYFRGENFLNHGYAVPLDEIAARLNREAQPGDLILMDAYNTDWQALRTELSGRTPYMVVDQDTIAEARRRLGSAGTVWILRNTRDISPGGISTRVQAAACAGRRERDTLYEPFPTWQRSVMQAAGMPPLTHFYQLAVCGPAKE